MLFIIWQFFVNLMWKNLVMFSFMLILGVRIKRWLEGRFIMLCLRLVWLQFSFRLEQRCIFCLIFCIQLNYRLLWLKLILVLILVSLLLIFVLKLIFGQLVFMLQLLIKNLFRISVFLLFMLVISCLLMELNLRMGLLNVLNDDILLNKVLCCVESMVVAMK